MRVPEWVNYSNNFTHSFAASTRSNSADAPQQDKKAAGRSDAASMRTAGEKGLFQELFGSSLNESATLTSQAHNDGERRAAKLESLKAFAQTWDLSILKAQNSRTGSAGAGEAQASKAAGATGVKREAGAAAEPSVMQSSQADKSINDPIMTRFKDSSTYSYEHSMRVGELAAKLADRVSAGVKKSASIASEISRYYNELGKYHDIGKYAIPFEILEKPGSLTSEEQQVVRAHPVVGESMLKDKKEFKNILPAVRHHHERWDGKGYPDGLKGNDIPLEARIISVVDSFDAIVSDRPYRKGVAPDKAIDELKRCAGTQFDPQIVSTFSQLVSDEYLARSA
jgi:HD-GYP domain-containing protein (c-di-GMP phosphodiesterase class II)